MKYCEVPHSEILYQDKRTMGGFYVEMAQCRQKAIYRVWKEWFNDGRAFAAFLDLCHYHSDLSLSSPFPPSMFIMEPLEEVPMNS